jgi:phospholipid/cholesterol/gamma-HCH transport system permease protein
MLYAAGMPADAQPIAPPLWSKLLRLPAIGLDAIGGAVLFAVSGLLAAFKPPYRFGNYIATLEFVGVGSLGIVLLTGAFTGAVFAIQTAVAFGIFNAKSLIGGSVALALVRELAPTMGALMVAGRVGSAMCTELGTMRVTEQIDALETMAVDPMHYLIAPRILACTVMMPMLAVGFAAIGLVGAYVVSTQLLGLDRAQFFSRIELWVVPSDILCTVVKGTAFGVMIGGIACYKGYFAQGGSRGVGLATTSTVVTSSIAVLLMDYVITSIWLSAFPPTGI